ncbi:MAG: alkaline phosphatase family protein [Planctomycetota bacterium]
MARRLPLLAAGILLGLAAVLGAQDRGRVIVIGFDGLDGHEVARRVAAGELPAFGELGRRGTLAPLATTEPAQSPVSWSSMITGLSPARTGIDGFVQRDFRDGEVRVMLSLGRREVDATGLRSRGVRRWALGLPLLLVVVGMTWQIRRRRRLGAFVSLAIAGALGWGLWLSETAIPDGFPVAVNARQGTAYWDRLDAAGVPTATALAPCSFPALRMERGELVCGFGVPDLLGTVGFWNLWRDDVDREAITETGGRIAPLLVDAREGTRIRYRAVRLPGPPNVVTGEGDTSCELRITVDGEALEVASGDESVSAEGAAWTALLPVTFGMSRVVQVSGLVRFRLTRRENRVEVYADPVQFDPRALPPGVALGAPVDLPGRIAAARSASGRPPAGRRRPTRSRTAPTRASSRGRGLVWDEQEALARRALANPRARVVTAVFSVPDRIQHMFARYAWTDRDLSGAPARPEFRSAIDAAHAGPTPSSARCSRSTWARTTAPRRL